MTRSPEDQFADALAHQLKTPTATIQAAAENLRRNLRALVDHLGGTSRGDASAGLAAFVSATLDDPAAPPWTGLMPADRVKVISSRLAAAGVEGGLQDAASRLARGGWDTYMDELAPLLRGAGAGALDLLETVARMRSNLAAIESAAQRVAGLASALRILHRFGAEACADAGEGLRRAAELMRDSLPSGVRLETSIGPLPAVRGQGELLQEVWANLLDNAVQAVGLRGSITLEAEEASIGGGRQDAVAVRVIDDGPGIPAGALPRLFEPFFTTRAGSGGTGLGLSLARRIVESAGGSITVDSRPGRTVFEVLLPAATAAARGE
ncbi:MAG TPA: ATP-binding protein [Candidatus Polarisedimenticolia bacterium]|nr:ATP-binding protein [Candidatus Polarisedimenticolia bacterium]